MTLSLENWLRDKLDELERMQDFEVGTETARAWIDQYNDMRKEHELLVKQDETEN